MLQTGVVQRRDVSILYSVILYSSHNLIMKVTTCYNNSVSRSELYAGHETEFVHYCDWAGTGLRPGRGTALSSVGSVRYGGRDGKET